MSTRKKIVHRVMSALPHDARRKLAAMEDPKREKWRQDWRTQDDIYSGKKFEETQSIFVHVPKAAGVSVAESLYGSLAGGHLTIQFYQLTYTRKEFESWFKFTIVRNPWDRLYSAYNFLQKGGLNEKDRDFRERYLSDIKDFRSFVTDWMSEDRMYSYIHFMPQTHFTEGYGGDTPLDFVGRFEKLQSDFEYIAKKVNPDATLQKKNITPSRSDYREAYTPDMIERVRDLYKDDIETFSYDFSPE